MADKPNSKITSIVLVIAEFLVIVWIIYIRNKNPDDSILLPLIIGGIVLLFFSVSFFGRSTLDKIKNLSKQNTETKILLEHEVIDMVYKIVEGTSEKEYNDGLFRNIKRIETRHSKTIGENEVYAILVRLSYPISFKDKQEDGLWIIINATYPSILPSILPESVEDLEKEMDFKSKDYKDKIIREKTTRNESLGYESTFRETLPSEEKEEPEEKEAGIWVY